MYIDFAAAIILIICIIVGEKRGIFRSFMGLFSWLFSITFSILAMPTAVDLITEKTTLHTIFSDIVIKKLKHVVSEAAASSDGSTQNLPSLVASTISRSTNSQLENTVRPLADTYADVCVKIVAFLCVTLVIRIILKLIEIIIRKLTEKDKNSNFNAVGGMICGLIKGAAIVYVLIMLFVLVVEVSMLDNLVEILQDSVTVKVLDSNNLLLFGSDLFNKGIDLSSITATP